MIGTGAEAAFASVRVSAKVLNSTGASADALVLDPTAGLDARSKICLSKANSWVDKEVFAGAAPGAGNPVPNCWAPALGAGDPFELKVCEFGEDACGGVGTTFQPRRSAREGC